MNETTEPVFARMVPWAFAMRVHQALDGPVEAMTAAEVVDGLTVADHVTNLLLNRAEQLGLVGESDGRPVVPIGLTYPEGVECVETILTRGAADMEISS